MNIGIIIINSLILVFLSSAIVCLATILILYIVFKILLASLNYLAPELELVLVDKKINPKLYYLLIPPIFIEGVLGES